MDDIKKEIIAFANCEGGKLYIGVGDDGAVVGVDNLDGAALQVSNMIRDAIKPDLTMFLHYKTLKTGSNKPTENTIDLAKEKGSFTRKEVGNQPDNMWAAAEADGRKRTDCSGGKRKKYALL